MNQTNVLDDNIIDNNNAVINENIIMNEQRNTSQANESTKDAKVSEYLNGINEFLEKMKNLQGGGGTAVIANERAKVAKLFNVLSLETLLNEVQNDSNTNQTNETS